MHCQDKPTNAQNKEYMIDNEVGELKITYAADLEGDTAEIAKERWKFASYCLHSMSQEMRHKIIDWNELKKTTGSR